MDWLRLLKTEASTTIGTLHVKNSLARSPKQSMQILPTIAHLGQECGDGPEESTRQHHEAPKINPRVRALPSVFQV